MPVQALQDQGADFAALVEKLGTIDPHAPDAAERIAALDEQIAGREETSAPANPTLGE